MDSEIRFLESKNNIDVTYRYCSYVSLLGYELL